VHCVATGDTIAWSASPDGILGQSKRMEEREVYIRLSIRGAGTSETSVQGCAALSERCSLHSKTPPLVAQKVHKRAVFKEDAYAPSGSSSRRTSIPADLHQGLLNKLKDFPDPNLAGAPASWFQYPASGVGDRDFCFRHHASLNVGYGDFHFGSGRT